MSDIATTQRYRMATIPVFYMLISGCRHFQGLLNELEPGDLPNLDTAAALRTELLAVVDELDDLTRAQRLMQAPTVGAAPVSNPVGGLVLGPTPEAERAVEPAPPHLVLVDPLDSIPEKERV